MNFLLYCLVLRYNAMCSRCSRL